MRTKVKPQGAACAQPFDRAAISPHHRAYWHAQGEILARQPAADAARRIRRLPVDMAPTGPVALARDLRRDRCIGCDGFGPARDAHRAGRASQVDYLPVSLGEAVPP